LKNTFSFKAARSNTSPDIKIPTDDELKLFNKKTPKPSKQDVVAQYETSRRFQK
jgi:hypothetical protein